MRTSVSVSEVCLTRLRGGSKWAELLGAESRLPLLRARRGAAARRSAPHARFSWTSQTSIVFELPWRVQVLVRIQMLNVSGDNAILMNASILHDSPELIFVFGANHQLQLLSASCMHDLLSPWYECQQCFESKFTTRGHTPVIAVVEAEAASQTAPSEDNSCVIMINTSSEIHDSSKRYTRQGSAVIGNSE